MTKRIRQYGFLGCLLAVLSLYPFALCAQSIVVSEELLLKTEQEYFILGKYDDNILLFRDAQTHYEIQAYNNELRTTWDRVLDFEKKNSKIFDVISGDTSFHIIYGYRHKGDYYLRHHEYDPKVKLIDTNDIAFLPNQYFSPKFATITSEDLSKVLIVQTENESEVIVKVYDLHTKEFLWQQTLLFTTNSVRTDLRHIILSNDGDMFIVMDHEKSSRRSKEFVVLKMTSGSTVVRKQYIDLDNLMAFDLFAKYDNLNNKLVLSGLYNEKSVGKSLGLYTISIPRDGDNFEKRYLPFELEVLEEVHGKEVSQKKGVSDFIVKDIIFRVDGGMLILAEMHKEYSRRPASSMRRSDYGYSGWVDYYLEDVIVYSVHPNGEMHWNTILHKKQYSQDDDGIYSSFFVFHTPEQVRVLFNDEIRHENTISEYVLRGNGYHKRNSVFSTDYQRLKLRLKDGLQVAYNECIIPSERNNRLNLVRITFDEL